MSKPWDHFESQEPFNPADIPADELCVSDTNEPESCILDTNAAVDVLNPHEAALVFKVHKLSSDEKQRVNSAVWGLRGIIEGRLMGQFSPIQQRLLFGILAKLIRIMREGD